MDTEPEVTFPETLQQAIEAFSDPDIAFRMLVLLRWPGGITCPMCQATDNILFIQTRRIWQCRDCKKQFSARVGTVMEDSALPTKTWLTAMWLIGNAKNGISSPEVSRALGITQKSAWHLLHRIRELMQCSFVKKLSGVVEADETFVGGLERNKHAHKKLNSGRGTVGKAIVMGMVERGGELRTKHIKDTTRDTLQGEIREHVREGSKVYTDTFPAYKGLDPEYIRGAVNHMETYVMGAIHTNNLEGFWNLFKRSYKGTWTHADDAHLFSYLDEQTWRYNERKKNDAGRFATILASAPGKKLTYDQLRERGLTRLLPKKSWR